MVWKFWQRLYKDYPNFSKEIEEVESVCPTIGLTEIPLLCRFREEVINPKPETFWLEIRKRLAKEDGRNQVIGMIVVICREKGIKMSENVQVISTPTPMESWWKNSIFRRLFS